ncbi:MAG: hypothetical protein WCI27_05940 [Candidatus Omnitrophota bacterium]
MRQRNDRHNIGMILLTVIATIMVMSILVIGVLSRNYSRAIMSDREVKHLQAEQIAKLALSRAREVYASGSTTLTDFSEFVDGTTYSVHYTQGIGTGPGGTTTFSAVVTY